MAFPARHPEKIPEIIGALKGERVLAQGLVSLPTGGAILPGGGAILPTGIASIDQHLPQGGFPQGAVVELAVQGSAALATSLGLAACRSAQRAAQELGGEIPWCAFIDPSRSLYAPGVAHVGVRLDRLLVTRPPLEALARVALKLVESQCFAVVVIDTVGVPGAELKVSLGAWPRVVRRLALALQETRSTAVLITDSTARRPLTLPVAQRIELSRSQAHKLILQVAKDKQGRISGPRTIELKTEFGAGGMALAGPEGEVSPLRSIRPGVKRRSENEKVGHVG